MLRKIAALLVIALAASNGHAQDGSAERNDEPICVGGPQWRASLQDAARIEVDPVPASYRSLFESTAPCVRWALDEASLIDWHLRFGTASSVAPALAYLEADYLRGEPAPAALQQALERAYRRALIDLRRAATIEQPQGINYSLRYRFTSTSGPIQRLEALVRTREKYVFLAQNYLRAAEEFNSSALLERAETYLRPAVAASRFLGPLESQPPVTGVLHFNLHTFIIDDLEMRAAVLRARLTRAPADVAAAETTVQAQERPYYPRLVEEAFSGGDDFCDISPGYGQAQELEQTCREADRNDEVQVRVVNQALARAMLNLVIRPGTMRWNGNPPTVMRLLERERLLGHRRSGRSINEDLLRLHLAAATSRQHLLEDRTDFVIGYWDQQIWRDGLHHLEEAERLAPPFEAPARFRRIAEAWLTLWRQGETRFSREDRDPPFSIQSPELNRYATYLHHTLAGLDAIATGADTGLPAPRN